jgi:hypothetical protein
VKGSFPADGDYSPYEYLSWANKFLADSLMAEMDLDAHAGRDAIADAAADGPAVIAPMASVNAPKCR